MANLTLSVDDTLLQRAREVAVRDRTSVNALVREFLERYVDEKSQRFAALDVFDALAVKLQASSSDRWTRASLHERE